MRAVAVGVDVHPGLRQYRVYTVAGSGTPGYTVNTAGLSAVQMVLSSPCRPWVNAAKGTVYFSEFSNNVVRAVEADGSVWRVAGTGTSGVALNGSLANATNLHNPVDVELSQAGDRLWIADMTNHRVHEVNLVTGVLTIIAGNGSDKSGPNGVAAATSIGLYRPYSTATNAASTHMWISEFSGHKVRLLYLESGEICTVVGTGTAGYAGDGGDALLAQLSAPHGLHLAPDGQHLFITDGGNRRIRVLNTALGTISTFAGDGDDVFSGDGLPPAATSLRDLKNVFVDAMGGVWVTMRAEKRVLYFPSSGIDRVGYTVAGNGSTGAYAEGALATESAFTGPWGVWVSADGNMVVGSD
ncbi:hypothetical protein EON62_05990, partial [archaeon]